MPYHPLSYFAYSSHLKRNVRVEDHAMVPCLLGHKERCCLQWRLSTEPYLPSLYNWSAHASNEICVPNCRDVDFQTAKEQQEIKIAQWQARREHNCYKWTMDQTPNDWRAYCRRSDTMEPTVFRWNSRRKQREVAYSKLESELGPD